MLLALKKTKGGGGGGGSGMQLDPYGVRQLPRQETRTHTHHQRSKTETPRPGAGSNTITQATPLPQIGFAAGATPGSGEPIHAGRAMPGRGGEHEVIRSSIRSRQTGHECLSALCKEPQ